MAHLEVLLAPQPLPEGSRLPLERPVLMGRNAEGGANLALRDARVSRRHCELSVQDGAWWAVDLETSNGSLVNGHNARPGVRLRTGDLLDVAGAAVFRFVDGEPRAPAGNPALEQALAERPDDPARWHVWADWLLEQGDPRGAWLTDQARTRTGFAGVLGPLARGALVGWLAVQWNQFGFARTLRVQVPPEEDVEDRSGLPPSAAWILRQLERAPGARFLTRLDFVGVDERLLELLADAWLPPSLRELALLDAGAVAQPLLERAERNARRRCPAFAAMTVG